MHVVHCFLPIATKNARSGAISSFDDNRHRARGDIRITVKDGSCLLYRAITGAPMNRTMWTNDERRGDAMCPAKEQKQKSNAALVMDWKRGPIDDGSQEQRIHTSSRGFGAHSLLVANSPTLI